MQTTGVGPRVSKGPGIAAREDGGFLPAVRSASRGLCCTMPGPPNRSPSATSVNEAPTAAPLPCMQDEIIEAGSQAKKEALRMATYVLVGGAGSGPGREYRRLREEGHDVYPVTLTGLGERVHSASAQVDLETHITDVVNLIEFEDLHDVVLLGHSYANLVVTGVADRIPRAHLPASVPGYRTPQRHSPHRDLSARSQNAHRAAGGGLGDGWRFPMPPPEELATFGSLEGLDDAELELLRSRAVDQPFGTFTQPVAGEPRQRCRSWVSCVASRSKRYGRSSPAATPCSARWLARFVELRTGHYPMFEAGRSGGGAPRPGAPTQDDGERRTESSRRSVGLARIAVDAISEHRECATRGRRGASSCSRTPPASRSISVETVQPRLFRWISDTSPRLVLFDLRG